MLKSNFTNIEILFKFAEIYIFSRLFTVRNNAKLNLMNLLL